MKINHNLSAVVANNKLHQNEDIVASSMERLSSGIRINHAKDDPAGMAISNRMTTQIDGVDRASQNSSDASAMIDTADGALGEITEILQRMRELCVQAANDTNAMEDKEAIQKEIAELKKEIDRMSRDTEFNTKGLLDGTLDNRFYPSKSVVSVVGGQNIYQADMDRISVSDNVAAGDYKMKITVATQTTVQGQSNFGIDKDDNATKIGAANAGTISINGFLVEISADDSHASAYLKICDGMEKGEVNFETDGTTNPSKVTSKFFGSQYPITIETSNPNLALMIGSIETKPGAYSGAYIPGTDAQITPDPTSAFSTTTSYTADGNHVTIHQPGGFEIDFLANPDIPAGTDISLSVTTMGAMQVQIGANENQTTHLRIPRLDLDTLYLDDLDVTTVYGADRGIAKLDWALNKVSSVRARIGAYENRLDHAVASLDQTSENLTKAFSDLSDVDMAEEMTRYTQYNVLVQASTSVLAQANDLPESVLQLLQ